MSDVVNFPGTSPLFEVDPEIFDRIARVTPTPFGRILLNRSLDILETDRYRSIDPALVLRQFEPVIAASMETLTGDLLEFDYDRRPALPSRVQRSARWHFDAKASNMRIGETSSEAVKNAIVGMTVLPTMTAEGDLPIDHELIQILNARPRRTRGAIQKAAQAAIASSELTIGYTRVGWASFLSGDVMHKGNPNPTDEPIPRGFFRIKEV